MTVTPSIAFSGYNLSPYVLTLASSPEFAEVQAITNLANDPIYDKVTKYAKNDTWFYFPKTIAYPTDYQRQTGIFYTIRYADLTLKTYYNNKTVAIFDAKKNFIRYEKAPTELAIYYPVTSFLDCSYWIDYTSANSTRRFVQGPIFKTTDSTAPGCWDATIKSIANRNSSF